MDRSYSQIFEYPDVTQWDPVFPACDKSTWRIDLETRKTLTCNSLTKQRKWRQHTILRMLSKQNLCQKHLAGECIRIRVDNENDSKTIGIRYVWTRIFWNPEKKKLADAKNFGYVCTGPWSFSDETLHCELLFFHGFLP